MKRLHWTNVLSFDRLQGALIYRPQATTKIEGSLDHVARREPDSISATIATDSLKIHNSNTAKLLTKSGPCIQTWLRGRPSWTAAQSNTTRNFLPGFLSLITPWCGKYHTRPEVVISSWGTSSAITASQFDTPALEFTTLIHFVDRTDSLERQKCSQLCVVCEKRGPSSGITSHIFWINNMKRLKLWLFHEKSHRSTKEMATFISWKGNHFCVISNGCRR